jgi:hypothetical protein
MKYLTLLVLCLTFVFVAPTTAKRIPPSSLATLIVSCGPTCSAGEPIIYSGTGYKSGAQVELDTTGPSPYTLTVKVNKDGTIYADFGTTLTYAPGDYVVTASAISGSNLTFVAASTFAVY